MHYFQLGQYKGLEITPQSMYTEADLDAAVIETILNLADQWSKNNMAVQEGDIVSISINADYDGLPVPELDIANLKYRVGEERMYPEFKKVIGKKKGDCFQMAIKFPQSSPILAAAGKIVNFMATVLEVYPSKPINITDDIARQIDPDVSSLDALKAKIRRSIEYNYQQAIRENNIQGVMEVILKNSTHILDQEELAATTEQIAHQILQNEIFTQNPHMKTLTESKTDHYFYEDCRHLAEQQILINLMFREVARLENFNPADYEKITNHLLQWNLAKES
ncbi:MAG: trigger factor [Desulfitobacteriia bacterium]|jgi:trigger factor